MDKELPKSQAVASGSHSDYIESLQSSILRSESGQVRPSYKRAYGVSVFGFNLLVEQGLYCELLTDLRISPLPNAPNHFFGVANVRGSLVPVYQLECLINGPITVVNPRMALLFDQPSEGAALAISEKPYSMNFTEFTEFTCDRAELPELLRTAVIKTFLRKNVKWYQVDHQALFNYLAHLK